MDPGALPLPMPPCIDDFDVGQELGKGGFAVVYRARVRATGLEVALKVVDKHRACEHLSGGSNASGGQEDGGGLELACARVANEVRLHWGLKHPAVVELLEFFEDERFVYLVLQLCGGGDLYRRLGESGKGAAGGPLDEREAAGYMGQLLAGLQYLHESGVMHRDLKLSNLLLSEDGRRLRIGDFGLAVKLEEEDSERNTICGTPNYMAPEVQGAAYGLSADLWSAGCLFYSMVTGGAPFQGRRVGDTLANARAGRYVVPEGLSDAAKDFLACLLSKDPTRRMRVEEAAAHPFLRLENQRPPRGLATATPTEAATPLEEHLSVAATLNKTKETTGKGRKWTTDGPERAATPSNLQEKPSESTNNTASPTSGKAGGDEAVGTAAGGPAGATTAAGHSTLTVSTAGLGSSDLCSVTSGFLDGDDAASFTTLRAEAVPTPATIGEGTAAAAARVRRATARAPFRAAAEGVSLGATAATAGEAGGFCGGSSGSGGGGVREARAPRRTARPLFDDAEGDWAATERDRSAKSSERDAGGAMEMRSAAAGWGLGGRFGWRDSADLTHVAGVSGGGGGRVCGRNSCRSDERRARETNGVAGGLFHDGNARDLNDGRGRKHLDGGRFSSGGSLAGTQVHPSGGSAFYVHRSHTGADRLRDSSLVEQQQQQKQRHRWKQQQQQQQQQQRQQQPPRRRGRRSRSTQALPYKQRQPTTETGDRTGRTRPTSTSTISSSSGSRSSEDGLPLAPSSGAPARRRRQREGGRRASRPPPPLPPQPPILPTGEQVHLPDVPRLPELREVRSAAAAERRLHETGYAGTSSTRGSAGSMARKSVDSSLSASPTHKAAGGDRGPLFPFSTTRVKPVSHRSEGKAAGVQVFPDGRAGITVGRRWLVASENGEQVWAGGVAGAASIESSSSQAKASGSEGWGAREMRAKEASLAAAAAKAGPTKIKGEDAGYGLRSLPEEFHPLYRSLAGIVNALRSKTPKVVLRREPGAEEAPGRAEPGGLSLCALMDNLPDPDFSAAFADGGSLSLWTRKNELRVELPSGRVRCWTIGPGSEWPVLEDGAGGGARGNVSGEGDGGGGDLDPRGTGHGSEEAAYLREGYEGYCRCLREETAAYQRRESFPVEVASLPSPTAGALAAGGGGKVRSWWRGEEDSSSTSSESLGVQDDEHGFDPGGGREGWFAGGGDGGDGSGDGSGTSGTLNPESSGDRRYSSTDDDLPGGSLASGRHHLRHRGRDGELQQQQQQQPQRRRVREEPRQRKPPLTPATVLEIHPPKSKPGVVTPTAPCSLFGTAKGQKSLKWVGESFASSSDFSAPSEAGERACPDTSSLTCSSISEGCPEAGDGEGRGGKGCNPVRGSGPVERPRDDGVAAVIPGLGEASRNGDGGLEVRFTDGVVVVVDAKATWMRVTRPPSPGQRQQQQYQHQRKHDSTRAHRPTTETTQSATYDLGRRAAEKRKGTIGAGRESGERMPRDVKDRMKVLPRFIAVLKGTPPPVNEKSPAGMGRMQAQGGGRRDANPPR